MWFSSKKKKQNLAHTISLSLGPDLAGQLDAAKKRAKKLDELLTDMLLLDPSLERFREDAPLRLFSFETRTWSFDAIHESAELLRSDAAEKVKRKALKKYQAK